MNENQARKKDPGATPEGASGGDEVAGARPEGRGAGGAAGAREPFRGPGRPNRLKKTVRPEAGREREFTGEQRLLMLDTWLRSKLPATEFSELVGVRAHTLYSWRKRFEKDGPAGLVGRRKGSKGSRLPLRPERTTFYALLELHLEDYLRVHSERFEPGHGALRRDVQRVGRPSWTAAGSMGALPACAVTGARLGT